MPRVDYKDLINDKKAESSAVIRKRVEQARHIQVKRLAEYKLHCNAQMNHALIKKHCKLTDNAQDMLKMIFEQMKLSARSYDRLIKVSQTIADLEMSACITEKHIAEAVQFRNNISISEV